MNSKPFIIRKSRAFRPSFRMSLSDVWKTNRSMARFIVVLVIIDLILFPTLYIKLFRFSHTTSFVNTIPIAIAATNSYEAIPGSDVEIFLGQLTHSSSTPMVVANVTRRQFSVPGIVVTYYGNNFQVFEYSDHDTALRDATVIAQRYASSSRSIAWKKNMHVYVNDKLVIFYMGSQDSILNSLDQNAGLAMMQSAKDLPIISKVGL